MGSTQTLQGIGSQDGENVAEGLADARELFSKEEDPPVSILEIQAMPEFAEIVHTVGAQVAAKGYKVDITNQRGRDSRTGEVQDFIRLEAWQ